MKNITKTLLVLVSALSISFAAKAGELAVSGSANASSVHLKDAERVVSAILGDLA